MAKMMTKSQVAAELARQVGCTRKQTKAFLAALATLAYEQVKNGFPLAGLGKLVLVDRQARMGRNPKTGEPLQIKAKKVVRFRVAKAAKAAILGEE